MNGAPDRHQGHGAARTIAGRRGTLDRIAWQLPARIEGGEVAHGAPDRAGWSGAVPAAGCRVADDSEWKGEGKSADDKLGNPVDGYRR